MQASAPSRSLVGFALEDRYRVLREIGRGGMGAVFEAEHLELGKRVAIKVILEKYANDPEAIARFKREALAASRIGNPHIIDVSHIGTAPDGRPFVVMELLVGEPLSRILECTGPMVPWRAMHIMRQVLRAVGAAHAKGIIHRDLKPDNIFIVNHDDQHDFVKLLDFGISKIVDTAELAAATRLTTTGVVMGTPLYMAPEQAVGDAVDHRADIYACGVILFEMLAGRPPFHEANYNVLIAKLLTEAPPHLASLRPGLADTLVSAVHRALDKESRQRFASAEAFAAALPSESTPNLELGLARTVGPQREAGVAVDGVADRRRWPWLVLGVALAGALATVIVVATREPEVAAPERPAAGSAIARSGKLAIKSIPDGARVLVDGVAAGTVPLEIQLPAGPHHLRVELTGFVVVDQDEEVRPGERSSVVITLQPAPAPAPELPAPPAQTVKPAPKALAPKGAPKPPPSRPLVPEHVVPEHVEPQQGEPVKSGPGAKPNPY